jgi:hypothetical protein
MKRVSQWTLLIGCFLLASAAYADPILTLNPASGALTGVAGATVGWGFTITNSTDYLVVTGSSFCDSGSSPLPGVCNPVSPNIGSYTDFIGSQFVVVGPSPENTSVSQTFDNTVLTGIGSFAINANASGTASGIIVMTYDLFSVSPNDSNFNPNDEISGGNFLTADASVTVGQTSPVPEPAAFVLMFTGFLTLLPLRFLKRAI